MELNRTIDDIARLVDGRVEGAGDRRLASLRELDRAGPDDLAVVYRAQFLERARHSSAGCLLLGKGVDFSAGAERCLVRVDDPDHAVDVLSLACGPAIAAPPAGIHERALVEDGAEVDPSACVEAFAYVAAGARVGPRVHLMPHAFVGAHASLGADSVLHPHAVVAHHCRVGERVVVHGGSVLGADGFGYRQDEDGRHQKIPQVGVVIVEDDVELGALVSIDRARFDATVIGANSKLDDQVHVGHNAVLGESCVLAGRVALGGSVIVGAHVLMGGATSVADGVTLGRGARVAGGSLVTRDVPADAYVAGQPAHSGAGWRREVAARKKLPELLERVRRLEQRAARP